MVFQIKLHNKKEFTIDDFKSLMEKLKSNFQDWNYSELDLPEVDGILHFHISSKNDNDIGVMEITYDSTLDKTVILKAVKGQDGPWVLGAIDEVMKFIENN